MSVTKINYLEIPVKNISATKTFFSQVFGWQFVDYGPDYTVFTNAGIDGGFYLNQAASFRSSENPLIVLYAENLNKIQSQIETAGGVICKEIFNFPGGCRFHFLDPNQNEFAVWSEKA